jgi:glutathione S-transferase
MPTSPKGLYVGTDTMKLYYAPLACSLADHIALHQAGLAFEVERVNLHTRKTETGDDFLEVGGKGYVPALVLDDGVIVTENVAILDWISQQSPALYTPPGPLGRTRVLEALAYVSTELHHGFKPMWHKGDAAAQAAARDVIYARLKLLADAMTGPYLLGDGPGVADFYLFVILLWARRFEVEIPARMEDLRNRLEALPAARAAMVREGLI